MQAPERGDFIYLDFTPQSGHEQAGRRPALVLSPAIYNHKSSFAMVCPITNQQKGYPFEVNIPEGNQITGVVLADQMKSLDWRSRNITIKGQAPETIVRQCTNLIKTILQIED